MAVDKGSLNYKIQVTDAFSRPIAKFRADLLKALSTAKFVKSELQAATRAISQLGVASARAGAATKKLTKDELARARAIQRGAIQQRRIERLRAQAFRDRKVEQLRLKTLADKAAAAQAKSDTTAQKAAKARQRAADQAAKAAQRAAAAQRRLNAQLARTQRRGNGLIITFKRLAVVFIGFQAIRFGADAIRESITAGIRFNQVIEDNRIGLAAMFATLRDIRDVQTGSLLRGADAFNASLGLADKALEKIRQRSLATAATFPELATAFRSGFAPGVAAGLDVAQIQEVTERVSQVLTGLGIAQNQINEEIRSLLLGTATARTSLVATLFFGGAANANKAIKNARELGTVFTVITERLEPFKQAAIEAQKSMTGLSARIRGVLEFSAGRGSVNFFNELKGALLDIEAIFADVTRTTDGFITNITPKPSVIVILTQAGNTMRNLVKQVRDFLASFTQGEVGTVLVVLGATVEVFAAILLGFTRGIIRAVALMATLFDAVAAGLREIGISLGSFNIRDLTELVSIFATILGIALTIKVAIIAWGVASKAATLLFGSTKNVTKRILENVGKIPGRVFTIVGAVGFVTGAFLVLARTILDIDLGIADLPESLGIALQLMEAKRLAHSRVIEAQAKASQENVRAENAKLLQQLSSASSIAAGIISGRLSTFDGSAQAKAAELASSAESKKLAQEVIDTKLNGELAIAEAKREGAQIEKDAAEESGRRVSSLELQIELRKKARIEAEKLAKAAEEADKNTKGFFATLSANLTTTFTGLIGAGIVDEEGIAAAIAAAVAKARKAAKDEEKKKPIVEPESFTLGLRKAFTEMTKGFKAEIAIITSVVSQFSTFAGREIIIALDPSQSEDGVSSSDRFKEFLNQIGQLILQKLIELAIASAVLNILGGSVTPGTLSKGGQVGGRKGGLIGMGFDEGGTVPGGRFQAPPQFRPASVAISDTVPAWLTPGEFVTPVSKVLKYGADLLEGIRQGALDPVALREAAGLTDRRKSVRKVSARGYAEGGAAGTTAAAAASSISRDSRSTAPGGGAAAIFVTDDQNADRILRGGQRAFRQHLENEKEFVRGLARK